MSKIPTQRRAPWFPNPTVCKTSPAARIPDPNCIDVDPELLNFQGPPAKPVHVDGQVTVRATTVPPASPLDLVASTDITWIPPIVMNETPTPFSLDAPAVNVFPFLKAGFMGLTH